MALRGFAAVVECAVHRGVAGIERSGELAERGLLSRPLRPLENDDCAPAMDDLRQLELTDMLAQRGKRGLLVALHGCDQTNDQLWKWGNLQATADATGLVVAVPGVGTSGWGPGCWNYSTTSPHIGELTALTRTLVARPGLDVDPRQVYVAGLSSGAAMSLLLGCAAPDLYAGVGAVAGPSVGSNQFMATVGPMPGNVANATATCRQLAGAKASFFASQVVNVAYGDMDKGGAKARWNYSMGDTAHSGQYAVVPVQWTQDNEQSERTVLGVGALGPATPLPGGQGTEWNAQAGSAVRLTKLEIANVGHAWPAGTGQPNSAAKGGVWIAQAGLDYPAYIAQWFLKNNARAAEPVPQPVPEASPTAWDCKTFQGSNFDHVAAGRAYDWWGIAYAKGSNQMLGYDNVFLVSNLAETAKGFYTLGHCK